MSKLDELVRTTYQAYEVDAPDGAGLAGAVRVRLVRRRIRWSMTGLAGATAVAVIAAFAVVSSGGSTDRVVTAPSSSVPSDSQAVSYQGVEIFVPKAWLINAAGCGLTPDQDTVIIEDDSPRLACLRAQPPGLTVVRMALLNGPQASIAAPGAAVATEPVTMNGMSARRGYGVPAGQSTPLAVLVIPDANLVISVESPDAALAARILDSARPTDRLAAGPSSSPGVLGDTQAVSYQGVEIFVPRAWLINADRCGLPPQDTVVVPTDGPIDLCLPFRPPGLTTVRMTSLDDLVGRDSATVATENVTVNGMPARRGVGIPAGYSTSLAVLVVPTRGVVISVESPNATLAEEILNSAHRA